MAAGPATPGGSGLTYSLLDCRPDVITTPDCLLLGFHAFWETHGHMARAALVSAFIDYYAVMFDARESSKCPRVPPDVGDFLNWTSLREDHTEVLHN